MQKMFKIITYCLLILSIIFIPSPLYHQKSISNPAHHIFFTKPFLSSHIPLFKKFIDNGSILIQTKQGKPLISYYSHLPLIPASTIKLITSLAAIHYLGLKYRFLTEFRYYKNHLHIKGFGDPKLDFIELKTIIQKLLKKGIQKIDSISLDESYFENNIQIPGNENSYASYDSQNSAIALNFNTIRLLKKTFHEKNLPIKKNEISLIPHINSIVKKAEKSLSKKLSSPKFIRISIPQKQDRLFYFGKIFKILSQKYGIPTQDNISIFHGTGPSFPIFYQHYSSYTLQNIIKKLLRFSNNFIANQLLFIIGASNYGPKASLKKGIFTVSQFIKYHLKISNISLVEGSGISYSNRVTAHSMVKLLQYFIPYKQLLKKINSSKPQFSIYAKSGTLKTVDALIGFIDTPKYDQLFFSIILNQSSHHSKKILNLILDILN